MDDVFGENGHISRAVDEYEVRPGQIEMSDAVSKAMRTSSDLFVEAPTGTGKSFAYLVPAIKCASEFGDRTVIATSNIALQEQLINKDLEMLRSCLLYSFDFGLAKGTSNFLCLDKVKDMHYRDLSQEKRIDARKISDWANRTRTGDKSELDFDPGFIWSLFSVGSGDCKGDKCSHYGMSREELLSVTESGDVISGDMCPCHSRRARMNLHSKDIVVCNYHLLFAHTAVKTKTGLDLVLPAFSNLVCDEAHRAADIARSFFEVRVSPYRFSSLANECARVAALKNMSLSEIRLLGSYGPNFSDIADELFKDVLGFFDRYGGSPIKEADFLDIKLEVEVLLSFIREVKALKGKNDKTMMVAGHATAIADDLRECVGLTDKDKVYFAEERKYKKKPSAILTGRIIDPGEILQESLFSSTRCCVFTSATLQVSGSFEFVTEELGYNENEVVTLEAESPFDLVENTRIVIPWMKNNPTDSDFVEELTTVISSTIREARGRTLALFTSYGNMRAVHRTIRNDFGFPIFRQAAEEDEDIVRLDRSSLLALFRQNMSSVLFGTESFWEGIDVPGESLSCVIIDKLPFPVPTDPVLMAREERGEATFAKYSLPKMIISLRQGVGRLIRRKMDRGVIVITDRRIFSKGYGNMVLKNLPKEWDSREVSLIGEFLDP